MTCLLWNVWSIQFKLMFKNLGIVLINNNITIETTNNWQTNSTKFQLLLKSCFYKQDMILTDLTHLRAPNIHVSCEDL